MARPKRPIPRPHASAAGARRADRASQRAREAEQRARHRGVGRAVVTPMSRRAKASMPIGEQRDRDQREQGDRRPVVLAGQGDVVEGPAPPGQVGERRQRRDRRLVAVEDEAGEHDRPGDPGGAPRPTNGPEGEGQAARRPATEARARSRSRRPRTLISSPGSVANAAPRERDRQERRRGRPSRASGRGRTASRGATPTSRSPVARTNSRLPRWSRRRASRTGRGPTRG